MPLAVVHSPAEWQERFGGTGRGTILTVGNFDGLHLGHQKILHSVIEHARATRSIAAAVTFHPHPLKVLRPAEAPPLIATLEQRLAGLDQMGLDAALVLRFDAALAHRTPEEFTQSILIEKLQLAAILVGENFRFGHRQSGDVRLLRDLGRKWDFEVVTLPPVSVEDEIVSSSAVRRFVREGRVAEAIRMLGRPFTLTGEIRPGSGRGSRILFPTLNLASEQELLPGHGVYATQARLAETTYNAATNVGVRPTFDGQGLTVESHLFDFSERVTAGRMEVFFFERLRDEKKFSSPEDLRAQIADDLERARKYFAGQRVNQDSGSRIR